MKRRNFLKLIGAAAVTPVALATAVKAKKPDWKNFWSRAIVKDITCTESKRMFTAPMGEIFWLFHVNFKPNATPEQCLAFHTRFHKARPEVTAILNEKPYGLIIFEGVPLIYGDHLDTYEPMNNKQRREFIKKFRKAFKDTKFKRPASYGIPYWVADA